MTTAAVVTVVGMKALARDLAKLTDDRGALNKALAAAGATAVAPIAAATRSGLPQDTGRLSGDVRVTSSKSGAAVRMGRSSLRYAGWVEFGGTRKVPHVSSRPFLSQGRYMFPRALELASTSAQLYTDAVTKAINAFPWTNSGTDVGAVHD
jgi:hypothetical protein